MGVSSMHYSYCIHYYW